MRSLVAFGVMPAFFLLGAAVACNGVLGIEEAALETTSTGGVMCTLLQEDPSVECTTANDPCEECLARGSATLTGACLTEPAQPGQLKTCRQALVDYRLCIGNDCTDEDGSCATCLTGSSLAAQLANQVRACPECRRSGLRSLCEEYCSCMGAKCSTKRPVDCEAACNALTPYQRYCRWYHCEAAESETSRHCNHAVGGEEACSDAQPDPNDVCDDGISGGLACDEDKPLECCSGVCDNGICARN
jgi:hypothetical protein